jgi:lactate dehydrogenase-like 2-hydroxyacid dehydrogenase
MVQGKVLVTGTSIREELLAPLSAAGLELVNPAAPLGEDALCAELAGAAAWLKGGPEIATARALEAAQSLKVLAFFGMGYESSVDVEAAKRLGIAVTITQGALNDAMADAALGLILSGVRRLHAQAARVERGEASDGVKRRDLGALNVGIVGMGGSGARIAEVLREGFRAPVSYYSRTRKPELETRLGLQFLDLDALMGWSDVLVVIVAANTGTWGLIDAARIARAKPGQILVNVARPGIVEPRALLDGLTHGPLDYAAFDGFYSEPADVVAQLRALMPDKLMVTPHVGSLTHEARDSMGRSAVRSILNILERGEDANRVV